MGQKVRRLLAMVGTEETTMGGCVGRIIQVKSSGDVLVDFPGNHLGPILARVATTEELGAVSAESVLLFFEDGDPTLPIVAGIVRNGLQRNKSGRELRLESSDEITISCGKSSIMLRSDGRVVIKGTELVSRASRTNKIRGAAIEIN